MTKRARVLGNDDDRPVMVVVEELHPNSRLKSVIEHDLPDQLEVGCSRDCLRSLIASERCGRAVLKGDTTIVELTAELDRDCVSLCSSIHAPSSVTFLCESLANSLASWPRMIGGMDAHMMGVKTEWDSGPMHCVIRFVSKPTLKSAHERPLGSLLHALIKWMFELTDERSADKILKWIKREQVDQLLESNPFWFVQYDDNRRLSRDVKGVADEIRERSDNGDEWCTKIVEKLQHFHNRMVDLTRLFHDKNAVGIEMLKEALHAHRLQLSIHEHYHSSFPPLIFPTAWCIDRARNGIPFMVQRF